MTAFLDSSALVKRYADEVGSDLVQSVSEPVIASDLAVVEVPAALWRKHRIGQVSATDAQTLCRRFLDDISPSSPASDAVLIEVSKDILGAAIDLIARHPLRAYDAVQLASALAASRLFGGCRFGCFDEQLNAAAVAEGLVLLW